MRALADSKRVRDLARELGRTSEPAGVYLTGGASEVLEGWRDSTNDVDMLEHRADVLAVERPSGDLGDRGLVEPRQLLELFDRIEPDLYRFPAIDPTSCRTRLERALTAPG